MIEIQAQAISWQPRGAQKPILDQVSCRFQEGQFTVILGPNGAGKSSLIKLLLRLKKPDQGLITLDQRSLNDFTQAELAAYLAYLPQTSLANYQFSAQEVIALGRFRFVGNFSNLSEADQLAIQLAAHAAGCEHLLDKTYAYLSGGEKQRVLCARAIAQDSSFIILDEPEAHLDFRYQHTILQALNKLCRERGKGIICILHDINLALRYADRVVLLADGRLIKQGSTLEVCQPDLLSQVYGWPLEQVKTPEGKTFYLSRPEL